MFVLSCEMRRISGIQEVLQKHLKVCIKVQVTLTMLTPEERIYATNISITHFLFKMKLKLVLERVAVRFGSTECMKQNRVDKLKEE